MTSSQEGRRGVEQPAFLVGITYEEDGWFYAVSLNHFLMTMARRKEDIGDAIKRMVRTYVRGCRKIGKIPFEDLGPAPDQYWSKLSGGEDDREDYEEVPVELLAGRMWKAPARVSD